ncbi:MAG: response regulator [Anaerolineales bacterium]|jgi:DNA-binding NtrC family response regulator
MSSAKPAILIVDDEGSIIDVLRRALTRQGYEAESAQNASQAFEILGSASFDLILCDLELPGLSGVSLYQKLVQAQPDLQGHFMFMTGEMLDPSHRAFVEDHQIPVLMKPFDLDELFTAVNQVIGQR